jgi:hypothetical protein
LAVKQAPEMHRPTDPVRLVLQPLHVLPPMNSTRTLRLAVLASLLALPSLPGRAFNDLSAVKLYGHWQSKPTSYLFGEAVALSEKWVATLTASLNFGNAVAISGGVISVLIAP